MEKQQREILIARFEAEMGKVKRPGIDKLLTYIRKSDFYTAPASTKYHLCTEGGLLQHSLNVLDALRGLLNPFQKEDGTMVWEYEAAGKIIATVSDESVILVALLHDLCKTYFYGTSTRNQKNDKTGKWEKVPFYTVNDKMPLGHGDKSAMLVKEYIHLESAEMYAIWWHMGAEENPLQFYQAVEKFPFILAVHTADVMASHFMEADTGNREPFTLEAMIDETGEATMDEHLNEQPPLPEDAPPQFEEAPPIEPGA